MSQNNYNNDKENNEKIDLNERWNESYSEKSEKTKDELMVAFAENFYNFLWDNIDNLKYKTLPQIFLDFLKETDDEWKEILEILKQKLWREITFNDIKYLYLKTWYTLFEISTRQIFEKFKQKEITKFILKKFIENISNFLIEKWEKTDLSDIISFIDSYDISLWIYNLFNNVSWRLKDKISNLPKNLQEELKNIKVTNEEIIEYLNKVSFITDEELNYLKWDIEYLNNSVKENIDINKLINIQSTLFNANLINTLDEINNNFTKMNLDLRRIFEFIPLWYVLKSYSNLKFFKIPESLRNQLDDNLKNQIENCLSKTDVSYCLKKVINDNLNNSWIQKIYLFLLEKNLSSEDKPIINIIEKSFNWNIVLSDEEEKYVLCKFAPIYKKNYISIIENLFWESIVDYASNLVDQIFDINLNKIILLSWKEISIEKNIYLPIDKWLTSLSDLYDLEPSIWLDLIWNNVDSLNQIFPEYFVKINDENISKYTKIKVTLNDWTTVEWFADENENWKIEIYTQSWASINPLNNVPIKIFDKENIKNIEYEQQKISLNWFNDVWKLLFNAAKLNYYFPNQKVKQNYTENENLNKENNNFNEIKKFKNEWWKIYWDENVYFEKWAILSVKWRVIEWNFWIRKNWYNLEIVDIDEKKWIWKIKLFWWFLELEDEWKIIELPINTRLLKEIKYVYDDYVFKFNKLWTLNEFANCIKTSNFNSEANTYLNTLNKWKRKINFKWNKLVDENWEEIKYIWKIKNNYYNPNNQILSSNGDVSQFFDCLKIDVNWEYVTISHPYAKGFSRKVDYNAFLMILLDNQLEPWTWKEFKSNEQNYSTYTKTWPNKWFFYYSIWNLVFSFKEIINTAKAYMKDEDDFRTAELLAWITKHIPEWMPVIWDMAVEADAEKEAKIWSRINSAKDRLARADKWWNHAKVAANIIKKEIFEQVESWKELSYRKKLRAAWYLLYSLEKWPWEYFRSLSWYAWKWMWVRALLWKHHHEKWKLQNQQLINKLKSDPDNEDIRNKIIFSEMFYIRDSGETQSLYSSNFWPTIDWTKMWVYTSSKVSEVYEWEASKANYYIIYDAWKSYLENNRPPNTLWALKAMTEIVEENDHYIDYYKIHLIMNLTWYVFTEYDTTLKSEYKKICKTYAVPIWLYATEYDWISKMLTIMDYIVRKKNIKLAWKKTFTEYVYDWIIDTKDKKSIDPFDPKIRWLLWKNMTWRKEIIQRIEKFWSEYWDDIVRVLDYRDPLLLKIDEEWNKDEKDVVNDYFENKVNDDVNEDFAIDRNLFKTGFAPYYQNWVLNLSWKAFSEIAWVSNWEFVSWAIWLNVWKALTRNLTRLADEIEENPKHFDFVFSKFKLWLYWPYKNQEKQNLLLKALISQDEELLNYTLIDLMKDKFWHYYTKEIPEEMENWLEKFKEIFQSVDKNTILNLLKKTYSTTELALAIAWLKWIISQQETDNILKTLWITNNIIKQAEQQEKKINLDSIVNQFLEKDLWISADDSMYIKLLSLIKKVISEKNISLIDNVQLSSSEKEKIRKFVEMNI